jgi:NAD(P)-dependent dehydrogenase (short-subunit alcohol dehydrogenase family)
MTTDTTPAFTANLEGKVATVLGASAEGGTGWAVAEELARCGAKVVVGARTRPELDRLADRIGGTAVTCDAAREADIEAMAKTALDTYGRLDVAVNCAGLPVMGLLSQIGEAELDMALGVNFKGQFYFTKHMAAAMRDGGSIVFVSSMSTTHPVVPHAAYACAKSASDCLIRYAAIEYADQGIRINSILPGAIQSDMSKEAFENPEFAKVYEREIPMNRVGQPGDFANAVLWLAGPAYVTGLNIQVNGGNQLTRMPFMHEMPGGREAYGSGKVLGDR